LTTPSAAGKGFHFAEAERMVNATAPDEESVFMEEAD
jgi:hypothetical protein